MPTTSPSGSTVRASPSAPAITAPCHCPLPIGRGESLGVFLAGVGEDDAARAVDDRAEALGVEGGSHVAGRATLGAVAGYEEPGVRHRGAQLGELLGIGGPDDGAHGP